MAQIINTNIASLTAQRNLNRSQQSNDTALARLSSGLRINSSKDDAAGLAISTRFDSQIRGANQAIRNSGDAISLAQTTEGALNSITSALQRMRELALQSANDTNTAVDRQALQEEVDQLVAEIKSVADTSNFNGKKLLDGSLTNATFQVGSNVGDTISFSIGKVSTDSLGTNSAAGVSSRTQTAAIIAGSSGNALVAGDLVINGISVQASVGSDDPSSTLEGRSSAVAKAAAVNKVSGQTGVVATVDANYVRGATGFDNTVAAEFTMALNGVEISLTKSTTLTAEQNLTAIANAINTESGVTGVRAVAGSAATLGITLIADDGRNIAIAAAGTATAAAIADDYGIISAGTSLANADVYLGSYTLVSQDGSDIVVTSDTVNIDNAGFEEGTYSGVNSSVVSEGGTGTTATALASGDLVINGVAVGPSVATDDTFSKTAKSVSAIAKAAAINQISDESGVTAKANSNRLYSGDIAAGTVQSNLTINGVSVSITFDAGDDVDVKLNAVVDAINGASGATGVTAETIDGDSFAVVAADGRNIELAGASVLVGLASDNYVSSVVLEGGGEIEISSTTGRGFDDNGGFRIGKFGGGQKGQLLNNLDISTVSGANDAVIAIDNAISTVTSVAATLGAVQNRFESVISNLELRSENLSSANSRITDADFAAETAALTRSQVLQQAGISILAQANARPQQVLSLLG